MDVESLTKQLILKGMTQEQQKSVLDSVKRTMQEARTVQKQRVGENVQVVIQALKKMEADIKARFDDAGKELEKRYDNILVGKDGRDGADGKNGQDGKDGRDGLMGPRGADGLNGQDGADGVSVTDAKIDFDGSLVITLSTGREINVGEVVAPDLAEKIKVITNGGGTSQQVLDAIAALQATIATYGTMALQNANAVAITGGTINGTVIGGATPAAGTFTTLTATGQTSLGGVAGAEGLRVVPVASSTRFLTAQGSAADEVYLTASGPSGSNVALALSSRATGAVRFYTNTANQEQMRVAHTGSAVNYVQVTGAATGAPSQPIISAQGSDANINIALQGKGTGAAVLLDAGGGATLRAIPRATGGDTFLDVCRSVGGVALSASSGVTNGAMIFQSKGTGAINLAPGSSGVNISNGGTVTAITRTAGGANYTSVPLVAISAPTTAGGVQATATLSLMTQNNATVQSGGSGYTVGNVLTVVGGTGGPSTLTVTAVSSGVITAATTANFGQYSVLPTNPVSVTGGTGSGATFNLTYGIAATFTITNAGSGYVEQPTVTFSGGGGSGAAAYASVGSSTTVKTIGANLSFNTPGSGEVFRVSDTSSTGAYFNVFNSGGSSIARFVSNLSGAIQTNSAVPIQFQTNASTTPVEQLRVSHTASAVNYVQVTGAATGGRVTLSAQGSDANVGMAYNTKGVQNHVFSTNAGNLQFVIANRASTVNWVQAQGNTAGNPPSFTADGSDTNIDLSLIPKGTGNVRFGTYTADMTLIVQGYIEIKDSGGTIRKLAVIA